MTAAPQSSSSASDALRREMIARIISPDWFDHGEALSNYPGQHRNFQDMALAKADAILGILDAAQAKPNLGIVGVESLADWFYNEGHEFVVSDEEEVARALLDQFDITPRRSLAIPSTPDGSAT